ncbi:FxsA family protein [Necropsobacter massiliensis]|uniref:FxsA family protein n=1 Tax=Necropsobacter massiliensis TaxID=1400001 RepID=UPI000595FACE|nr:FxsA family protein [Necropsobacter massiliensis]
MPAVLFILSILLFIYAELSVLIWLGTHIGIIGVLLLLVLAFLAGMLIIRMRGWYSLTSVQRQLSRGEIPTRALIRSGIWIFAGLLLMLPGLVSDILALALLTPWGSGLLENAVKHKISLFSSGFVRKTYRTFHRPSESDIFEAEYEKQVDEDKRIK